VSQVKLRRFVLNWFKGGSLAMRMRWFTEKYIEPRMESCTISRNQAQAEGEACLVSRNEPMHDSVPYLRNALMDETDILQEYFVPQAELVPFIDGLRQILRDTGALLLNASVRVVHREDNFLTYAPQDQMLAVVLYLNQTTDREGHDRMVRVTREVIDLSTRHHGRFFLPYQLHYSREQLEQAYPEIPAFFAARREFDPDGRFTNTFAERYGGGR
jgi:FAD/FMN-containing dehydrogenase